ncbi:MAG TPA: hypothetical protein VFQ51_13520 [Vicinamibacteria bacterium]|nr:hypothetical protein [Vicinamibacteria bacterium]
MPSLLVSAITYAGVALGLAGAVSLIRPLRVLHVHGRRSALGLVLLAAPLYSLGAWWPWPEQHAGGDGRLDAFLPSFQFVERHETRVRATPDAVYRAVRAVRADEIRTFRTLTWIRSPRLPWRQRPESILDPRRDPILDVSTRSGFVWLVDEPGREAAVGAVVCCRRHARPSSADQFRALAQPGLAKAGMTFRIEDVGGGECRLTTETRVFATDAPARRRFGLYWALIYPGSSLIRYGWLAAIKQRAEADVPRTGAAAS